MQAVLCCIALAGCDCNKDRTVPFGLDRDRQTTPETQTGSATTSPHVPAVGERFEGSVRTAVVEGVSLDFDSPLRALLAWDLDQDGDRDVLALTESRTDERVLLKLTHSARIRTSFSEVRVLDEVEMKLPSGTTVSAHLSTLSNAIAEATVRVGAGHVSWIVSLEPSPRVRERVQTAIDDPPIIFRFEGADAQENSDDRAGLVAHVRLGEAGRPHEADDTPEALVVWRDTAGGFSIAREEPEASLNDAAESLVASAIESPEASLAHGNTILGLHRALCRESGEATVEFSGAVGITCGPSAAAGRTAAARVIALAALNRVGAAVDAAQAMDNHAVQVSASDRRRAMTAIDSVTSDHTFRQRRGPEYSAVASPTVRLAPVGFLDDDRVVVRGAQPKIWNVVDDTTALSTDGALVLTDPSTRFAATALERSCRGYELVVTRTADVAAGLVLGPPVSRPVLQLKGGVSCAEEIPPVLRNDRGGWQILGWAPQGVVATTAAETVVVPLTVAGTPSGVTRRLAPGAPPPAPVAPGAMTARGEWVAIVTDHGILLRNLEERTEELWRLPNRPESKPYPTAVAPSPNGRRLAFVEDGHVVLVERAN